MLGARTHDQTHRQASDESRFSQHTHDSTHSQHCAGGGGWGHVYHKLHGRLPPELPTMLEFLGAASPLELRPMISRALPRRRAFGCSSNRSVTTNELTQSPRQVVGRQNLSRRLPKLMM